MPREMSSLEATEMERTRRPESRMLPADILHCAPQERIHASLITGAPVEHRGIEPGGPSILTDAERLDIQQLQGGRQAHADRQSHEERAGGRISLRRHLAGRPRAEQRVAKCETAR
jgi:hypothetical protein